MIHPVFRAWRSPIPVLAFLLLTEFAPASFSQPASTDNGRQLALAEGKGHCQACHQFPNDPSVKSEATVGPPLAALRSRFPNRGNLIALIRDARTANRETIMPPYGTHRILTETEIAAIADYLLTQ